MATLSHILMLSDAIPHPSLSLAQLPTDLSCLTHDVFSPLPCTPGLPVHASSGGTGPCFLNKQDPSAPEPLWYTNASSGHLCAHRGSNGTVRFEIHQDGTHIQCGLEFDSFIEEDTPIYAAVPVGIHPSPPLRNLTHITVGFTVELLGRPDVRPRCGSEPQCQGSGKIDYGYAGERLLG